MVKLRAKRAKHRASLGRGSRWCRPGVRRGMLEQGEHQQGTRAGKEPSGIYTGAAGKNIFKQGQCTEFKTHGTEPWLKAFPQERASFTLLISLYLKIAYSLSTSFFLNSNLMISQYVYWERKKKEQKTTRGQLFFFAQAYLFLFEGTVEQRMKASGGSFCMIRSIKHSQAHFNRARNVLDPSFSNLF